MKEGGGGREARKKERCEIRKKDKTVVDRPEKACVHAGCRLGYTFLRGLDCHSLQRTGPVACTLTQWEVGAHRHVFSLGPSGWFNSALPCISSLHLLERAPSPNLNPGGIVRSCSRGHLQVDDAAFRDLGYLI